jgi:hypothetical protein
MVHVSGNATWQPYPSTGTQVTAARLEAIEGTQDGLYASEYGGPTRTQRPAFRATRTSTFTVSGDTFVTSGWTVAKDTDAAWVVPGGSTASYYQIPISGRVWDIFFKIAVQSSGASDVIACKVSLAADVFQSIVSAATGTAGFAFTLTGWREARPLTAGDRLYFSMWCSSSRTFGPVSGGAVVPEIIVRDVGPAT